ncbi:MAG: type II secretion system F family protein [Methylotenera sp.]|uniref:type II secretion system F family protein n=1 Tax=Methylotenera sp. TaxID=2051956 RepID=UPI00183F78AB|nr:type II secretion system F family protein [Methylotenera sp.]NOU25011.1 type II secretion system F family protein [Methylotenera sp.]
MKFELKVMSDSEAVSLITIDAISAEDAKQQVKLKGLIPLSVKHRSEHSLSAGKSKGGFQLLLFSHELLQLLKAGLSLVEAMETLREKEQRAGVKLLLDDVTNSLFEGLPLSAALAKNVNQFNPLYVAMVKSSEKTGDLVDALRRYIDYQVQVNLVRKKIISASIYPAILLMVGGMVIMFLMLYVVPKFSVIYEGRGTNLPLLSQWLLAWGGMLAEHSLKVLIGFIVILVAMIYGFTRPSIRQYLMSKILLVPMLGEKMKVYQLARFYRTAGMLLKGGIPVMTVLDMVSGLLRSDLSQQLALARNDIKEGLPLSIAMEKHHLTTPVAVRMMRVGEKSGQMGQMMENIGDFYEDEISRWVDWFTKLFEPILMALIGLIVGVVVVLMYMPIFDLAGSIQ